MSTYLVFMKRIAPINVLIMLLLGGFLLPTVLHADTIIGVIDWDTNIPATPWAADPAGAAVSIIDAGDDDWLRIDFSDAGSVDPDALISGRATDLFAGTWNADYWIEFDFWHDSDLPDALQVRWGDDGSTNVWGTTLNPNAGAGGWQTLRTSNLGDGDAWDLGLGDPSEYLTDLTSIDWIGVYIDWDGTGDDSFGVDDFSLMVPEPAELMMLAAALGVGLLVMRRMRQLPAVE